MEGEGNRPWPESQSLPRRAVVEGIGTAFLLTTVVGSGIMGERLFGGNAGLTLLANSLATGAGLVALDHCLPADLRGASQVGSPLGYAQRRRHAYNQRPSNRLGTSGRREENPDR
jgi:hypothetical protein